MTSEQDDGYDPTFPTTQESFPSQLNRENNDDDGDGSSIASSIDWCEGSIVGSLALVGGYDAADCASLSSGFSSCGSLMDVDIGFDDNNGINGSNGNGNRNDDQMNPIVANLEPVKIESTLSRRFSTMHRANEATSCCHGHAYGQEHLNPYHHGQATVVSESLGSMFSQTMQDELPSSSNSITNVRDNSTGTGNEQGQTSKTVSEDMSMGMTYPPTTTKTVMQDSPVHSLPDELLAHVFSFLDVDSLLSTMQVSKWFNNRGCKDEAGWSDHCDRKWSDKANVCWRARQLKETGKKAMLAYKASCEDAKSRHEVTVTELCYDPVSGRGTVWHFRFKESAGAAWTSIDPWHNGLAARKMVFLRDGTVRELVETDVDTDGSTSVRVEHPFHVNPMHSSMRNEQPARQQQHQHHQHQNTNNPPIKMRWRILLNPMDMPVRPRGAYIRLNVGGRDVPTYIVQRSPTGNWGFIMENCWALFATFPLPCRQQQQRQEEEALRRRLPQQRQGRIRLRRTNTGSPRWLNVEGMESDSEEEDGDNNDDTSTYNNNNNNNGNNSDTTSGSLQNSQGERLQRNEQEDEQNVLRLLEDNALPTTSIRQWREALLYNYGAVSLPEGNAGRDEFDRIFDVVRAPDTTMT